MDVIYVCCFKEVYRFPTLVSALFGSVVPTFCSLKKIFLLFLFIFCAVFK